MKNSMRCYCVAAYKEPLVRIDAPVPEPTGDQVLIRVQAAGVCHSDLHIWEGGYDLGNGRTLSLKDRGAVLPQVLGHETAGEAVAAGPDAKGIELGRSYLVYPWIGCGACPACKAGDENLCPSSKPLGVLSPGGYADYILVPRARYLLPLDGISPSSAAPLACSGVTAYSALKKAGSSLQDVPVVVLGVGGLGLMCISIARAMGAKGVVAIDVDPRKRDAAISAGALAALDPQDGDIQAQVVAAVGCAPMCVVDFVGSEKTSEMGFNFLAKGGRLILVGLFGGAASFPLALIATRGITIAGNLVGNLADMTDLLDLVRSGKVPPIPIVERPLDDANAALGALQKGSVVGRTILIP